MSAASDEPMTELRPSPPASSLWQERLWLQGSQGKIEAMLSRVDGAVHRGGVLLVCPHPRLGGDFENNVIAALASFLAGCGFPVLRFNYHGVGQSEHAQPDRLGRLLYWAQLPELDARQHALADALAAHRALAEIAGEVHVVGYSLGAILAFGLAARGLCRSATAIALPIDAHPPDQLEQVSCPVLALQAPLDFASRLEDVQACLQKVRGPVRLQTVAGADHFFVGLETTVAAFVADFLAEVESRLAAPRR